MTLERLEEIKATAYWFDDVSTIGSLVRELIAAVPVWRPIAEAPKDGSKLIWCIEGCTGFDTCHWDRRGEWLDSSGWVCYPTHFLDNLPAPPPLPAAKEESNE